MNYFRLMVCFAFMLGACGCAPKFNYMGNKFPDFSSLSYPSFDSVSSIPDEFIAKFEGASGKSFISLETTSTKNDKSVLMTGHGYLIWDYRVKNNLVYGNHSAEMTAKIMNEEKKFNFVMSSIHERDGTEIKNEMNFNFNNPEIKVKESDISDMKKDMSQYFSSIFALQGKTVKQGTVIRNIPNPLLKIKEIPVGRIKADFPEKIIGLGLYKGKKVVVSEIVLEDGVFETNFIVEIRGKGFNLYDAETFINLAGKSTFFSTVFTPKEGTLHLTQKFSLETP